MRGPRLRRGLVVLGAATLIGLVAASCTTTGGDQAARRGLTPPEGSTAQVAVAPGAAASATLAGVTVRLPTGTVDRSGTLRLSLSSRSVPLADHVRDTGAAVQVELLGTTLRGHAEITTTLPADLDPERSWPLVLDGDGVALGSRWTPGQATLTATTSILGGLRPALVDLVPWATDHLAVRPRTEADAPVGGPECVGADAARDAGVVVVTSAQAPLRWCVGIEAGSTTLRVTNTGGRALTLGVPTAWTERTPESSVPVGATSPSVASDPAPTSLAVGRAVVGSARSAGAASATTVSTTVTGAPRSRVVARGETVTLIVPEGAAGTLTATDDALSALVAALARGTEVYQGLDGLLGVRTDPVALSARLAARLEGGACPGALAATAAAEGSRRPTAALRAAARCLPGAMVADDATLADGPTRPDATARAATLSELAGAVWGAVARSSSLLRSLAEPAPGSEADGDPVEATLSLTRGSGSCSAPTVAAAVAGELGDVVVEPGSCAGGWAVVTPACDGSRCAGQGAIVVRLSAGTWRRFSALPATICRDTVIALGAPTAMAARFPRCASTAAPAGTTGPATTATTEAAPTSITVSPANPTTTGAGADTTGSDTGEGRPAPPLSEAQRGRAAAVLAAAADTDYVAVAAQSAAGFRYLPLLGAPSPTEPVDYWNRVDAAGGATVADELTMTFSAAPEVRADGSARWYDAASGYLAVIQADGSWTTFSRVGE